MKSESENHVLWHTEKGLWGRAGGAQITGVLDVAAGSGAVLMNTLAVEAAQQGFMEGCVHIYTPRNSTPFPGLLLATGLEDYCESMQQRPACATTSVTISSSDANCCQQTTQREAPLRTERSASCVH